MYVQKKNKRIKNKIKKQLNKITYEIFEKIGKKQIESILLTGSFGRGEGSVLEFQNKLLVLNDYDILVVLTDSPKKTQRKKIKSITLELSSKFKIEFLDIGLVNKKDLDKYYKPTMFNFDLINSLQVLYGSNPFKYNIVSNEIPEYEGTRLLINRIGGLLQAYYLLHRKNFISTREKIYLNYQCMKAILAIGDAWLLSYGKYDSHYKKKKKLIEEINIDQKLKKKYKKAVQTKLNPKEDFFKKNPDKNLNQTKNFMKKNFFTYEKKRLNKELDSILVWSDIFLEMRNKNLIDKPKSFLRNFKQFGVPKSFQYVFLSPSSRKFCACVLLFYSLNGNKKLFLKAKKLLNTTEKDTIKLIEEYMKHWHDLPYLFNKD